jgi:hypothetical protein
MGVLQCRGSLVYTTVGADRLLILRKDDGHEGPLVGGGRRLGREDGVG